MNPGELRRYQRDYPYTFVVGDETCPKCNADLMGKEAVHFQALDSPEWEQGSANPPFGRVTLDPVDVLGPEEDDIDLRMPTNRVRVCCSECGHSLKFTSEIDQP